MTDYINREALEAALEERYRYLKDEYFAKSKEFRKGNHYTSGFGECFLIVGNFPNAADVAPIKHAEWIPDEYGFYHCSACGYEWDESEYRTYYCPNCGAKMGGDND